MATQKNKEKKNEEGVEEGSRPRPAQVIPVGGGEKKMSSAIAANSPISKYQKFKIVRMHRSQIKKCPYNPRTIDPFARKKLLGNIKDSEVGLLEPIIYNEHPEVEELLSGHQRLGIMDELERQKAEKEGRAFSGDYSLDVSVVSLNRRRHKAQLVFLNNPQAQGQYDMEGLRVLVKDEEFSVEDAGFEKIDVQEWFPDDEELAPLFDIDNQPKETQDEAAKLAEIAKMQEARRKYRNEMTSVDDGEFIAIVVFEDSRQRAKLMKAMGRSEYDKYCDGPALLGLLGLSLEEGVGEGEDGALVGGGSATLPGGEETGETGAYREDESADEGLGGPITIDEEGS